MERLAWRAALAVAPDAAGRRRAAAEKQARVTVFREESGTVGLSGRDLPAAEALAGHANVLTRAAQYQASGAFPGRVSSALEALAYVDLLGGVSARERIAFAASADAEAPAGSRPDGGKDDGDGSSPEDCRPGRRPGGHRLLDRQRAPGPRKRPGRAEDDAAGRRRPWRPEDPQPPGPPLTEVTVPLATLQRRAERAGDNRLLGPLDPALARDLAAAAARSPWSRWELTIVDENGYATGHGTARPARGASPPPPQPQPQPPPDPASPALPARINITITETFLHQLEAQATQFTQPTQFTRPAQPRSGAPPGAWHLTPESKPGTWTLTLPGGRQLTTRFDVVPTHDCDHRYAVSSYLPGDRLRRLIQVRDHECTWPPCSRPARDSDFEHAIPYDKGGITDACNAGARSRRCHQVKQLPGWTLTQPKPGWHVWTTPTGRTYVQEPWRYTA